IRILAPTFCLLLLALFCTPALAQDDEQAQLERQRQEEQQRRQQQLEEQRIRESREQFVNSSREDAFRFLQSAQRTALAKDKDFINMVPEFRNAVTAYREAVSLDISLNKSLKGIGKLLNNFETYFKETKVQPSDV